MFLNKRYNAVWMGTTHLEDQKRNEKKKRTDYGIFTKIHVLFSPENELGSSSEEEFESDSEDEVYIVYYNFHHILFVLLL